MLIRNIERLELICQRLRGMPMGSVEELQVEVEKALDSVLQVLKSHKRELERIDIMANRRRFLE